MSSFAVTPVAGEAHPMSDERKLKLGMLFYVLTDVAFVIFLFISYIWLRAYNTDGGWFPFSGMRTPDTTASLLLTLAIVLSAVAFFIAYRGIVAGNQMVLRTGLVVAVVLVIVTLIGQMRFMGDQQFATIDGSFASSWIMLNGYHVYHLFVGLFLGLALTIRAFRGKYTAARHVGLVTVGYFWYWMALTPVILAIIVAIFPPKI